MALTEQQQRDLDQAVREWNGRLAVRFGYPASRKRPVDKTKAGFTTAAPAAAPSSSPLGGVWGATFQVNAGASVVVVSAQITVPFVVYHFSINSNVGIAEDVRYRILVASNNDTSGGTATSGISIDRGLGGDGGEFAIRSFAIEAFPNYHARDVPAYVKFAVFNNIAAARVVHMLISLRTI